MLEYCEIQEEQLAVPKPSGTPVGFVKSKLSKKLGISKTVLVVAGGHDQTCGALGAGIYNSNQLLDSSGTFGIIFASYDKPVLSSSFLEAGLCMYPHAYPANYCSFGMIPSAGAVFRWFRDQFGEVDRTAAAEKNIDVYDEITSHFKGEPSGVFLMPHFSGSGTPHMNPNSKGSVLGLTLSTSKYDFGQAILEGITYEIKTNVEIFESIGEPIEKMQSIGGGAKSDYWLQLKANILQKEIHANQFTDLPLLGSAILAGFGFGSFNSLEEIVAEINPVYKVFTPQPEPTKQYQEAYQQYKDIQEQIAGIH
jgi:xylulokinase